MHHHDQDLIMELAEGALSPQAATAAQAQIDACTECSRELELQLMALGALRAMPSATLTELESVRLRRALRQELGLAREVRLEPSRSRRRMPIAALATAAAVLVAVVVIGPGLNLVGGGSSDDAFDVAATAAPTESPAESLIATDQAEQARGEENQGASQLSAVTTTVAGTPPAVAVAEPDLYAFYEQRPDLLLLRDRVAGTGYDEDQSRSLALRDAAGSFFEDRPDDAQACIGLTIASEDNFVDGFQIARGEVGGRDVLYIVYLAEDLEESALIVHAADNCDELGRAP